MFLALQQTVTEAPIFSLIPGEADVIGGWLVCFFTLAVFSFLYKDNPFYKIAEHIFVALGTAWFTMQFYDEGIKQPVIEYMFHADGEVDDAIQLLPDRRVHGLSACL